jgi:pilus assembly protein FimV
MLTLAAVGAILPSVGHALGLGEIRVNSALNEPLDAEVDILAARPGEVEELIVSLADTDTFQRAGLDRPYVLTKLRFEVERRPGGQPFIRIFTRESVREPFLSFLVEADWAKGRVVREFTILLDPPVLTARQPSRPVTPAPAPAPEPMVRAPAAPAPEPEPMAAPEPEPMAAPEPEPMAAPEPVAEAEEPEAYPEPEAAVPPAEAVATAEPLPEPEPAGPPAFDSEQTRFPLIPIEGEERAPATPAYAGRTYAGDEYGPVAENETLWSIAQETRQGDVSMSQMMLAYLRVNPEAFVDGNINRMRKGFVLRVPSRAEVTAVSREQALAQVKEQNGLWREYVARVSGETYPQAVGGGDAQGSGSAQTAEAGDNQLTLVATEQEGEGASGTDEAGVAEELSNKLALSEEALEAARVENEELRERIGMLEEQVSKMQRLIELKQDELAELQMMQRQSETAEAADEPPAPQDAETVADTGAGAEPAMEAQPEMEPAVEPEPFEPEPVAEEPAPETMTTEQAADAEEPAPPVAAIGEDASEAAEMVEPEPVAEETPQPTETEPVAEASQSAEQADADPDPAVTAANETPEEQPGLIRQYLPFLSGMIPSGAGQMLGNPMTMGAAVGVPLVLLLGGTMIYLRRRQSGEAETAEGGALSFEDTGDLGEENEDTGLRAAPDDAGPDMTTLQDITDITAPGGDFTKTELDGGAQAAGGEDDKDDTVSEVDVYLAYGLFQQAEDLLQDVIKDNPNRQDYRLKLLETHYAAKNKDAFVAEAETFHKAMGDSESPHWERVLAMGAEIAPDHALFSGADTSNLEAPTVDFAKPETADIGLDEDDTETRATDVELDDAFAEARDLSMTQSLDLDEIGALPDGEEPEDKLGASAEGLDAFDSTETELLTPGEDETQTEFLTEGEGPSTGEIASDDGEGLEFDLGELSDLGGEDESELVKTADETPVAADELELPGADQPEPEEGSADFEKTMMALPDFELPGDADTATPEPEAEADLTDVDITEPGLDETVALSSGGDEDDLALPEDVDEVGTKLDLAKAFIDMGDTDGARGTLEEVLAEGNDDQKAEAQRLMQQM